MKVFLVISALFLLQLSLFTEARFLGVSPELPLLISALLGLHFGVERGTALAFGLGLLYDIALGTPLGAWALVCCVAAYPLGAASATLDRKGGPWVWLTATGISFGGICAYAMVTWMVGRASLSDGVVRVAIVGTGYNAVISPAVARAVAWAAPGGSSYRAYAR